MFSHKNEREILRDWCCFNHLLPNSVLHNFPKLPCSLEPFVDSHIAFYKQSMIVLKFKSTWLCSQKNVTHLERSWELLFLLLMTGKGNISIMSCNKIIIANYFWVWLYYIWITELYCRQTVQGKREALRERGAILNPSEILL